MQGPPRDRGTTHARLRDIQASLIGAARARRPRRAARRHGAAGDGERRKDRLRQIRDGVVAASRLDDRARRHRAEETHLRRRLRVRAGLVSRSRHHGVHPLPDVEPLRPPVLGHAHALQWVEHEAAQLHGTVPRLRHPRPRVLPRRALPRRWDGAEAGGRLLGAAVGRDPAQPEDAPQPDHLPLSQRERPRLAHLVPGRLAGGGDGGVRRRLWDVPPRRPERQVVQVLPAERERRVVASTGSPPPLQHVVPERAGRPLEDPAPPARRYADRHHRRRPEASRLLPGRGGVRVSHRQRRRHDVVAAPSRRRRQRRADRVRPRPANPSAGPPGDDDPPAGRLQAPPSRPRDGVGRPGGPRRRRERRHRRAAPAHDRRRDPVGGARVPDRARLVGRRGARRRHRRRRLGVAGTGLRCDRRPLRTPGASGAGSRGGAPRHDRDTRRGLATAGSRRRSPASSWCGARTRM